MKRCAWKNTIVEATKAVGTYREGFDITITLLAELLEAKDECRSEYKKLLKARSPNAAKARENMRGYYREAKPYLSELGLTSAGLKKINDESIKPEKRSALAEALSSLE